MLMLKMIIKKYILINSPPKKVWKSFSQLEKWPEYCNYIEKAYWTSPKKWALNSTFVQIIKIGLIRRVSHPKIIKIKKGKYATWTGTGSLVQGIHSLKFEKIGKNKTKVINKEYFKGPLAFIIFPLIKNKFEKYFEQFLKGLKKESEK